MRGKQLKRSLFLLIVIQCFIFKIAAQQEQVAVIKENITRIDARLLGGFIFSQPDVGFLISLNGQLKNANSFGLGVDVTFGIYESRDFNDTPLVSDILNFPETDEINTLETKIIGSSYDSFTAISFYGLKEFTLFRGISISLQAGPSIALFKERSYQYRFNPGSGGTGDSFAGFNFGTPPFIAAQSTMNNQVAFGGYARALLNVTLTKHMSFDFSPVVTINSVNTVFGVEMGLGFHF